jgi:hypothetical protein
MFQSETRDSLREIAEQTGGFSLEPNQDLGATLERIRAAVAW